MDCNFVLEFLLGLLFSMDGVCVCVCGLVSWLVLAVVVVVFLFAGLILWNNSFFPSFTFLSVKQRRHLDP